MEGNVKMIMFNNISANDVKYIQVGWQIASESDYIIFSDGECVIFTGTINKDVLVVNLITLGVDFIDIDEWTYQAHINDRSRKLIEYGFYIYRTMGLKLIQNESMLIINDDNNNAELCSHDYDTIMNFAGII